MRNQAWRRLVALVGVLAAAGCGVEPECPVAVPTVESIEAALAEVRAGTYQAPDGPREVTYALTEVGAVAEGDILLSPARLMVTDGPYASRVDALAGVGRAGALWPEGVVPYTVHPELTDPRRLERAMAHWEERTFIRFVPRTDERDYVQFVPGPGCGSHVGRVGGRQPLYAGPGCSRGALIHELGHLVGLWHEQSRPDRDAHVAVVWDNVDPEHRHNFERVPEGRRLQRLGPYDVRSVMHYGGYTFSCNGGPTLVGAGDGQPLPGNRSALTELDVAGVEALYGRR